jgi:hypothetical protein
MHNTLRNTDSALLHQFCSASFWPTFARPLSQSILCSNSETLYSVLTLSSLNFSSRTLNNEELHQRESNSTATMYSDTRPMLLPGCTALPLSSLRGLLNIVTKCLCPAECSQENVLLFYKITDHPESREDHLISKNSSAWCSTNCAFWWVEVFVWLGL